MATIVNFTSLTPFGAVVDQATNVAETAKITLRLEPLIGNGVGGNGGSDREAAEPNWAALVDASGCVLPAVARLYKTSQTNGQEIAGTDVPLKFFYTGSAFRNGRPVQKVYFDLQFTPEEPLDTLTSYAFDYTTALPGVWRGRHFLDFEYSQTFTGGPTSGFGSLGITGITGVVGQP